MTWYSFNPVWIDHYIHYKVRGKMSYPSQNFNRAAVEVWNRIANFIPPFKGRVLCSLIYRYQVCKASLIASSYSSDLLDVSPAPQNGTAARLYDILVSPPSYQGPDPPMEAYDNCPVPDRDERVTRREARPECTCDNFNVGRHSGKIDLSYRWLSARLQ